MTAIVVLKTELVIFPLAVKEVAQDIALIVEIAGGNASHHLQEYLAVPYPR